MRKLRWRCGAWLGLLLLAGCRPGPPGAWQGYLEGEFVYVGAPLGGQLKHLAVRRGLEVATNQLLFELEGESEAAAAREARQRVAQAVARLENLRKGRRPSEIAALEGQLQSAQASLELSRRELDRRLKLMEDKVIAPQELDAARTTQESEEGRVKTLRAELETARLGARSDEIEAAEADQQAARAALERAQWAAGQKRQSAPTQAWVHDTLYREGEFVAAGQPVVVLLPPANLKVRFFVPQEQLPRLKPGAAVLVSLDGASQARAASVSYVAPRAEFTPPVIYSKESRAKLVFMVEAIFAPGEGMDLRPGQPVDVRLGP
jgi:HlyD family secretion protein